MTYEYDVVGNLKRHEYNNPYKLSHGESKLVIEALEAYTKHHPTELGMIPLLIDLKNYEKWFFRPFDILEGQSKQIIMAVNWYKRQRKQEQ